MLNKILANLPRIACARILKAMLAWINTPSNRSRAVYLRIVCNLVRQHPGTKDALAERLIKQTSCRRMPLLTELGAVRKAYFSGQARAVRNLNPVVAKASFKNRERVREHGYEIGPRPWRRAVEDNSVPKHRFAIFLLRKKIRKRKMNNPQLVKQVGEILEKHAPHSATPSSTERGRQKSNLTKINKNA